MAFADWVQTCAPTATAACSVRGLGGACCQLCAIWTHERAVCTNVKRLVPAFCDLDVQGAESQWSLHAERALWALVVRFGRI